MLRYFSSNEPWVLAKELRSLSPDDDAYAPLQARLNTVLYVTIDAVRMSGTSRTCARLHPSI